MLARFAVRRVAGASCLFFFSSSAPARLQKLWIPERALEFTAGKASGPGGQNINKSLSKIEVRFHIGSATWIDENTKERLREQNRNRVNQLDEIFLYCERHRTPLENRREAMAILQRIVEKARRTPPPTPKPEYVEPEALKAKRVEEKRYRSKIKEQRKAPKDW
eukprot:TRINITY_DN6640_c0_g2_i4.p1 TRINITY_DN6640_c0_g2~~TRINITY_DN6640_c0_g2_i4.p1  ORF type:complete len:164 (-),score=37.01 TRINITY_DN6640_c0_g2_i4:142-633(-)